MLGNQPVAADAAPLVLIVEDDRETRQLYVTVLTSAGFRTDAAHNGLQAFDKAVAVRPDLIITDIAVPGIDGIELCRRLRSNKATEGIPLLAVTGYDDRHYPDRVLQAGANRVLLKPLDPETLLDEARRLLETARAQSTAGR